MGLIMLLGIGVGWLMICVIGTNWFMLTGIGVGWYCYLIWGFWDFINESIPTERLSVFIVEGMWEAAFTVLRRDFIVFVVLGSSVGTAYLRFFSGLYLSLTTVKLEPPAYFLGLLDGEETRVSIFVFFLFEDRIWRVLLLSELSFVRFGRDGVISFDIEARLLF